MQGTGKPGDETRMKTSMLNRLSLAAAAWAAAGSASAQSAQASYTPSSRYGLQTPVTEIASQIYDLHNMMLVICALIFVAVSHRIWPTSADVSS